MQFRFVPERPTGSAKRRFECNGDVEYAHDAILTKETTGAYEVKYGASTIGFLLRDPKLPVNLERKQAFTRQ